MQEKAFVLCKGNSNFIKLYKMVTGYLSVSRAGMFYKDAVPFPQQTRENTVSLAPLEILLPSLLRN